MNFATAYGNKRVGYPRINLDHVVSLKPRRDDDGWNGWDCIAVDGNIIGTIGQLPDPVAILPNTAPITLIAFWLEDGAVHHQRYAVLAWHIEGKCAEPITCHWLADEALHCYEQRLGDDVAFIFEQQDCVCASWDEALIVARRDLDRKRAEDLKRQAEASA